MNWKAWIPLGVAVVLGLLAAKLAGNFIASSRAGTDSSPQAVHVVVAKRDIAPGQTIRLEDLSLGTIPAGAGTEEAFGDPATLAGRVLIAQIRQGQAIVRPLLAPENSGSGLQVLIPEGMRAITVEVNEFSGLAGLLIPGCSVDLIATLHRDADSDTLAKTIVQNVKVTAVGQRLGTAGKTDEPDAISRSVTLLVTPQQAESVQLACTAGRPWLILRGSHDRRPAQTNGVSLAQLRGLDSRPEKPAPAELPQTRPAPLEQRPAAVEQRPQRTVQLIRAGVESSVVMELSSSQPPPQKR